MEHLTNEQREISKLEIQLDVCKRNKDAIGFQLSALELGAAEQSVHLTALRRVLMSSIFMNVVLLLWVIKLIGGR